MSWTESNLSDPREREELRALSSASEYSSATVHMNHDLGWLEAGCEAGDSAVAYTYSDGNGARGYAVLFRHQRPLNFSLGELTYFRKELTRYELWAEPLVAGQKLESTAARTQAEALLELAANIDKQSAISIEAVKVNGPFHRQLMTDPRIRRRFLLLEVGNSFRHHRIELPETYEGYLEQLSASSRKSLKYKIRKLRRKVDGELELRCYRTPAEVDAWLDDAIAVSRKTYQWNLLGLGLRNRPRLKRQLDYAAGNGWFRCYVLFCRGEPVAFMQGLQVGNTYFYEDVGYDPDWAKLSVGSVQQLLVTQDLIESDGRPLTFDFSTGDADHKATFGTAWQHEVNLLLFPRTPGNRVLIGLYRFSVWFSNALRNAIELLRLKPLLKHFLRRVTRARA